VKAWFPLVVSLGLISAGCGRYDPPNDGVPKGCVEEADFDVPLQQALGISSHVEWGCDPTATAYREFETATWEHLKAGTIRRDLTWAQIERNPGTFDFSGADRAISAMAEVGAEPLAILNYGNSWAREDGVSNAPPDDLSDFETYATATAEHYRGQIRDYEIWNEPNVGVAFWDPQEDPVAYGDLLVGASGAVRSADPDARVIFGGVFHQDVPLFATGGVEFIAAVHDHVGDLSEHVDAISFHPYRYPFTAPDYTDEFQPSQIDDTCEMIALRDEVSPGTPLWVGELGWHTADRAFIAGVTPEEQADYLVRSALLAFAHGMQRYMVYTFRDSGTDAVDQEQMFGLYDYDPDPTDGDDASSKPAGEAYRTLAGALGKHRHIRDVSKELGLGAESYAYELSGGKGTVYALWTTAEADEVLIPGKGKAKVGGKEMRAEKGAFSVGITPSPVFVYID